MVSASPLTGSANLLVMPTLDAANIALTLLSAATEALLVGPAAAGRVQAGACDGAVGHGARYRQHDRPGRGPGRRAKAENEKDAMEVLDLKAMAEQAIALHQQGKLAEAETLYLQILEADPALFGPRYYLGLMRLQQGRADEACDYFWARRSTVYPDDLGALMNYGMALRAAGRAAGGAGNASTGRWRSSPTWPKAFTIAAWRWPT